MESVWYLLIEPRDIRKMDKQKIIILLKVILILVSVMFIFSMFLTDTSDCAKCSFELKGKEIGIKKFMNYYYEECLREIKSPDLEYFELKG